MKQTDGQRGTCLKSKSEYSLPSVIAGKEVMIKTDVVESHIPLLLSRTAFKMDLENDSDTIIGKEVALNLTTSGHHCIPKDKSEEVSVESVCAVKLDALNRQDTTIHYIKTLLKLHSSLIHTRTGHYYITISRHY